MTSEYSFEVLSNEPVSQAVWRMRCQTELAHMLAPGQFVNICVPGDASHVLRIPLSFSHADGEHGTLELVYAIVGEGTRRLAAMRREDESTMVGPCGRGWWLPKEKGRALLIAGGVGLPPVVACARMLVRAGIGFDAIVGSQTAARHIDFLLDEMRGLSSQATCDCARKVIVTTDDGTRGIHGLPTAAMTDLLAEHGYSQAYACGPYSMLRGVAQISEKRGIACQVSMERMMGCGFGACSCCNVQRVDGSHALCCTDGPVFEASEVAW